MELKDKEKKILNFMVREYIRYGIPVGSQFLSEMKKIRLAASTIRKVLQFLEKEGYIIQMHKSGGRIPTDKAYRFYIDEYVKPKFEKNKDRNKEKLPSLILSAGSTEEIYNQIALMLSKQSRQVALLFRTDKIEAKLLRISLILREGQTIMYAITFDNGETNTGIFQIDYKTNRTEVNEAEQILNQRLEGLSSNEIKTAINNRMRDIPPSRRKMIDNIINHKESIFKFKSKALLIIGGINYLISQIDLLKPSSIEEILSFIEQKEALEEFLSCRPKETYQVSIGTEHKQPALSSCSIMTYPINKKEHRAVLGILGPTKMQYSEILNLLYEIGESNYEW